MFETSPALRGIENPIRPWELGANLFEVAPATVATSIDFSSIEFLRTGRLPALQPLELDELQHQAAVADPTEYPAAEDEFLEPSEEEELTLTMNATEFAALEDRVARVVEIVKKERQSLTAAQERAQQAEAELTLQAPRIAELERELEAAKSERQQAYQRLSGLLTELESLEF